eukprot:scaffold26816_cov29-Tisochrysis_lutea.AAC.1
MTLPAKSAGEPSTSESTKPSYGLTSSGAPAEAGGAQSSRLRRRVSPTKRRAGQRDDGPVDTIAAHRSPHSLSCRCLPRSLLTSLAYEPKTQPPAPSLVPLDTPPTHTNTPLARRRGSPPR